MSDLESLPGISPKAIEHLAKLNITDIFDLLFHLPIRYYDRTVITNIADITCNSEVQVIGQVYNAKVVFGRRRMMTAVLRDDTGEITLRFFYFSNRQVQGLADGKRVLCFGEPRRMGKRIEMIHPQYRILQDYETVKLSERLEAVYPTTKGLQQKRLQSLIDKALKWAEKQKAQFDNVLEGMPEDFASSAPMLKMLSEVHKPLAEVDKQALFDRRHPAQKRLVFDELLAHHISIMRIRLRSNQRKSYQLTPTNELVNPFVQNLPFNLTNAQGKVLEEIKQDVRADHPMMRLVQGDVGSGKTVVALITCLYAVENQYQAAIMAPTELLAEQHFRYFSHQLLPLGIQVAWLSSGTDSKKT